MIYIYDILLNFCDSDLLYDFYEWDDNDDIDNIKRIKLVHVSNELYDKLLKYDVEIDNDFLIRIFRTCEVYGNRNISILDYCCLFSDGNRVIAIEFDKAGNSIYKSKLLIDEESEIALLACNLEILDINLKLKNKNFVNRFDTRNEMVIKKFLMSEVSESYKNKKYDKLRYLYQEYFYNSEVISYKKMRDDLVKSINNGIDDKHKEIYYLLKSVIKKC